uniref:Uncharacterized protein n=1 Tax=Oreochromis aureus TaxID=47969 RepID=A0AAZ1Y3H1_OREAU
MKRGEKPEGYRQRRPKTFPVTNYSGNSQQMLQEIRNSLRNLSKPSDPPKVDTGAQGKMLPEDSRQLGRSSNPKNPHHKTLQEIREALMPFKNEPNTSGFQREPRFAGLEESFHLHNLLWKCSRCRSNMSPCFLSNYSQSVVLVPPHHQSTQIFALVFFCHCSCLCSISTGGFSVFVYRLLFNCWTEQNSELKMSL